MKEKYTLLIMRGYMDRKMEGLVDGDTYKRHLLNHMSYSHTYLMLSAVEWDKAEPVHLCEAAMHAAACAWCIADYHNEATPPEPIPAEAWEGVANRWIKAVEKWSKHLKSNQSAAYAAPIRERAALKELPLPNGVQSRTKSTAPAPDIASSEGATSGASRSGAAPSKRPITGSGASSADDRAAREAFYTPPAAKRSHKKKPAQGSI